MRSTEPEAGRRKPEVSRRKGEEGGYALLLVLLLASLIAISLYKELPRVAFDTQRQREQILIERGEQYKRAIQVFTRANNRFPTTLDELENLNNKHYLRHRYKDPMTGKDAWRLVHIAGGVLTDSVLNKPKQTGDQANATDQSQYLTQQAGIDQSNQNNGQPQNVSAANRRRASEGGVQLGPDGQPIPGAGALPGFPGAPGAPADPNAPPGSNPTASGAPPPGVPGMPGAPGLPGQSPGTSPGNLSGSSGSSGYMSSMPGLGSSSSYPGNTGAGGPGAPVNSQVGGVSPYSTAAGANGSAPGYGQPGMGTAGQSQAAALIGGLLTQPRPGGMAGLGGASQGQVIGGGIAGVASKAKGDSIMVYDDRTDYSEWEFNWDPIKAPPNPPNPNTPTVGTPMSQAASASSSSSGFGNSGMSSLGSSPGGTTPSNGSGLGGTFGSGASSGPGTTGGFSNGGAFNSTTANGGMPGGMSPGGMSPNGTAPNGSNGQTTPGGFAGGGVPPNIRPGAP